VFIARAKREVDESLANGRLRSAALVAGAAASVGETLMPYHQIDDPTTLRRALDAVLLIEADLELSVLLRHVTEEACAMTGARYGALGVLDEGRAQLAEFITVGLEPDQEEQIGPRPTGRGVLGPLMANPAPLRLSRISAHQESFGFPDGHPPMTSFLGVPIKVRDDIFGNLYLTEKIGWGEFTREDEALVASLAVAAGIAIENALLHRQVQREAVTEDRERMARDLHDTVIQTLFAAGLSLQAMAESVQATALSDQLSTVASTIDMAIRQLRSAIYDLGLTGDERGLRARIVTLLRELTVVSGFAVHGSFEGLVDSVVSDAISENLLATIREAVTNVVRHAGATQASVRLSATRDECLLQVTDNGRGLGPRQEKEGGLGLNNMRRRAEKLHGSFKIESQIGGTVLTWRVPLCI
jgi:two-component system, NarL family, sensor histidine kinase DevS